ncbi:unnamed protein product [Ceratitis capitata]|uniref:(Mediterranean fruit fly) hypothetical protein n=1 Tax=Ceratitis capitata TaxID=7213 RepID=A0A811V1Y4_CERCA|nr:unnamed protein product [Ceratitis capitata]
MSSKFYEPPSNRNDIKEAQIEHQQQNLNSQREQRQRQRANGRVMWLITFPSAARPPSQRLTRGDLGLRVAKVLWG